jgi:hypothetical protein
MQKSRPTQRFLNGWLISGLAAGFILALYGLHWKSVGNFVVSIDQCEVLFCDFYRHFYPMGRELFISFRPAEGFFYSPFAALLFSWSAAVSSREALVIWSFVQMAALAGLYLLPMVSLAGRGRAWQVLYSLVYLTSFPLLHNLKWGQVSVIVTLLILAALVLYDRGQPAWSAAVLALAIAIKYYPAIFLVYFLFRRDLRYLLTCGVFSGIMVFVLPVLLLGFEHTLEFYRLTGAASARAFETWMRQDLNTQYVVRVADRLLTGKQSPGLEAGFRWLGLMVSGLNIALLWAVIRSGRERMIYWAWSLLFSTLPFWLATSWPHYFVFLPISQVYLLVETVQSDAVTWKKVGLGILITCSGLFSSTLAFFLIGRWQDYSSRGFLFFANALLILAMIALLNLKGGLRLWPVGWLLRLPRRMA